MQMNAVDLSESPGRLMVHFVLADQSHEMDAWVLHECEGEILALVKEVAKQLGISMRIETMAHGEGGLEVYLNFIGKHAIALGLIGSAVTAICSASAWWHYQSTLLGQQIEANSMAIDRDKKLAAQQIEQNELNLRKTRLELRKMEQEVAADAPKLPATDSNLSLHLEDAPTVGAILPSLLANRRIIKLRSQLYESLLTYDKVEAIGFANTHTPTGDEETLVPRARFQGFVVSLEDLEPRVIERADIEIIAPVLTRDGGKWRGRFGKRNISFVISDDRFLMQVALKQVKFQNGTSMICRLVVHQKEDEAGIPQPHEYVVNEVHKLHSKNRRTNRLSKETIAAISMTEVNDQANNGQGNLLPPDA
ncbi:hypothetical protein [Paracidovorax wautersii]|uniref:Uncharacterized protein n=1 Tax=Paracidovorax wautersii TaxID=1177982 RepID=A0A1I2EL76_9BURK|nr:hypothetical protein [Paracidovorax wautersii]SFE93276.1 hypothetical protein SAMN04489711_107189 [Paracidovorax wautersii]